MVRRAVAADKTRPIDREQHRQLLQRDVMNQLIVGALQEGRVDRHDGTQSLGSEARGEGNGVLLGDRDIKIAVGKASREFYEPRALAHGRRNGHDARVALGDVAQPLAEDLRIARSACPFPCEWCR